MKDQVHLGTNDKLHIVYITCTSGGRVDERRAVSCYTDVRSNCSKQGASDGRISWEIETPDKGNSREELRERVGSTGVFPKEKD